ncbi:MAG TPA: efflux transporter outer membrane subunit [Gammaproteobacteria bacterium]|nr:efflux transporter outer membrane subunit [Gammaproteobacteria bacterium]
MDHPYRTVVLYVTKKWMLCFIASILYLLMLTGCMVGPNFHAPRSPHVSRYTETPLPHQTAHTAHAGSAGKSQVYEIGKDMPEIWWSLFHSPALNRLVQAGIDHNPNLSRSYATLREAQEVLNAQIGNSFFPAFDANLGATRQRFPGASLGGNVVPSTLFNLFNASVSVSYTLDVFGGARRETESLMAHVERRRFELIAVYLTLTSNIVTTAITMASLESQIKTTQSLITAEAEQLAIIKKQYQEGGVSAENVLSQQTLLNQTQASLPPLQKSLSQTKHSLSVLVGEFPNEPLPDISLEKLVLPARIPVSLPSQFVRQRPDVRVAEAEMHSACALVGVATADLFPKFNLSAGDGWQSTVASTLIRPSNKFWSIGIQLLQPIFHGGALLAHRRAAIAVFDQTAAQYRETLLQAFQNVADSLRALETDARTFKGLKEAELAAKNNLSLTRKQYILGGVNYLDLLNAQVQYQQIVISRIQAQATRYNDTVALFQSLGGGWWNRSQGFCKDSKDLREECLPG